MKKLSGPFINFIAILGIPAIINLYSEAFFIMFSRKIWVLTISFALLIFVWNLIENFSSFTLRNKILWKINRFISKTTTLTSIFLLQLILSILITLSSKGEIDVIRIFLPIAINIIGLNLLILFGKLENSDPKEILLHVPSTGKVFYYTKNSVRHIPDPETFIVMGFSWSDLVDISEDELGSYKILPPITSIKEMNLIDYGGKVYGIVNEKLRYIPDFRTLEFIMKANPPRKFRYVKDIQGFEIDKAFPQLRA
jgi:hypothetical protein